MTALGQASRWLPLGAARQRGTASWQLAFVIRAVNRSLFFDMSALGDPMPSQRSTGSSPRFSEWGRKAFRWTLDSFFLTHPSRRNRAHEI